MRALLASPLGFLIGLSLGALGGGGSILAVPVLVYVAGQSAQQATTTSLVLVGSAAAVGMVGHWKAGRVKVGMGVAFGLAGIGGSLAGTALNRRLDAHVLLLGFSVLVVVAAWRMLTRCPTCTRVGEADAVGPTPIDPDGSTPVVLGRLPADGSTGATFPGAPTTLAAPASRTTTAADTRYDARLVVQILAAGTGVGFLTGLFGVGGGFVIVPALALVLHLAMPQAIGTSLLVIAINSVVALGPRLTSSTVDWAVTLPFAASAMGGVTVGAKVADKLPAQKSLRAFAGLLVAVAIYTAAQATVGLLSS